MPEGRKKTYNLTVIFTGIALIGALFSYLSFLPSVLAATGINEHINFQGKVVNTDGTNVTNGSYTFLFCIYTTATPTTACTSGADNDAIWRESKSITVTDGIFQTNLGDTTTLPGAVDFNTDNIYLGINFNANGQMTPLVRFTAAPYALNAAKVGGLTVTDTTGTLTIPNAETISFGGSFSTSASNDVTLTTTGATNVTLPTTGTLATLAGIEILTNKTIGSTGLTFSGATTDITTASGESLVITAAGAGTVDIQDTLTADSLTLDTGSLTLQNSEVIGNGTDDLLTFVGAGGTDNTDLYIDLDGTSPVIYSNTDDRVSIADFLNVQVSGVTGAAAGDIWYDSAANKFKINENGTTKIVCNTTDAGCGAGGSSTLQTAYDASSGNTILTTTGRNIAFTLGEVATPTSLTIENQDTAGVSAQRIFNSIASGTLTNGLLIEQTGAGTLTNAIQIAETAGTITDGILITGTLDNILNSGSIDITGAGAITGATGISSTTGTFSSTITANGGLTTSTADQALTFSANGAGDFVFNVDSDTFVSLTGGADGVDAMTITSGGLTLSDGDLTVSAGDANFTLDTGDTLNVVKTGASAGDVANIAASSVNAIDGLQIDLTSTADATVDNVNGLAITWTESSDTDVWSAINIANTTTTNSVTQGLVIGTGYDTGISVASGGITATGSVVFTNTGAGVSLQVNDVASDTTPMVVDADGNVGIGTSTPARVLDVVQAASAPQLRLSKDLTYYSEFTVDSVGDLQVAAVGGDIRALSENVWICDIDACPALTLTGEGNIFVENVLKFGNGVYIKNDSATELSVYDNDDQAMLIFDEL